MAKVYARFQTKTVQKPYPMGRSPPSPPPPPPPRSRHSITKNIGPGKTISDQFLGYKISTKQKEFFFLCLVTLEVRDSSALSIILSEDTVYRLKKNSFHVSIQKTDKIFISSLLSRPYGTFFRITWQSYGLDQYSGLIWCFLQFYDERSAWYCFLNLARGSEQALPGGSGGGRRKDSTKTNIDVNDDWQPS